MNVKKYFHSHANQFDGLYRGKWLPLKYFDQIFRAGLYERYHLVFEHSGNVRGKKILDVGCGSGRYTIEFAKRGASKVVGMDFAPNMIAIAKSLTKENGVENACHFIDGDFMEYDFGEQKFDISIAIGVFDYLKNPEGFLKKLLRITTEKILISLPRPSLIRMTLRKLRYYLIKRCPVYFYGRKKINQLLKTVGSPDYKLIKYKSNGYLLEIEINRN